MNELMNKLLRNQLESNKYIFKKEKEFIFLAQWNREEIIMLLTMIKFLLCIKNSSKCFNGSV